MSYYYCFTQLVDVLFYLVNISTEMLYCMFVNVNLRARMFVDGQTMAYLMFLESPIDN